MFETIIATLITSFLGLLAFLAYRHPEGFGRINFILLPLSVLGGGFLIGWDNAITESTLSLERLFSDDEYKKANAQFHRLMDLRHPSGPMPLFLGG